MGKITTARINLNPTEAQDTFSIQMLGAPGQKRAYRLLSFGISGALTGAGGSDGVIVGLQDGGVEPALIDSSAVASGDAQRLTNADAMFDSELSVIWSLAISATGSGNGWNSTQKNWFPGFLTPNPITILFNVLATGFKRMMVHLEYEQVSVSSKEWTELKNRSPVVDLLWTIET